MICGRKEMANKQANKEKNENEEGEEEKRTDRLNSGQGKWMCARRRWQQTQFHHEVELMVPMYCTSTRHTVSISKWNIEWSNGNIVMLFHFIPSARRIFSFDRAWNFDSNLILVETLLFFACISQAEHLFFNEWCLLTFTPHNGLKTKSCCIAL